MSSRPRKRRRSGKSLLARRMRLEVLEDRRLLSIAASNNDHAPAPVYAESSVSAGLDVNRVGQEQPADRAAPQFALGEILVGFEGEVAGLYRTREAATAPEAAGRLVAP